VVYNTWLNSKDPILENIQIKNENAELKKQLKARNR
jgi:hypothetical protein